jgi:hypothetical protein
MDTTTTDTADSSIDEFVNAVTTAMIDQPAAEPATQQPAAEPATPPAQPVATPPPVPAQPQDAPAEVDPLDAPPPKHLSTKAAQNFKLLQEAAKKKIEELRKQNEELAKKTATPAAATELPEEVKARLDRAEQMSRRLEELDIQSHPTFVANFVEPVNQAVSEIVEQTGADEHTVRQMLNETDRSKRSRLWEDIISGSDDYTKTQIGAVVANVLKINATKNKVLERRTEALEVLQRETATRQRQEAEQATAAHMQAFDNVLHRLKGSDPLFTDPALEPIRQKIITDARAIYAEGTSAETLAAAAIAFGTEPHLRRALQETTTTLQGEIAARDKRIKELEAQISAGTAAEPRRSGGVTTTPVKAGKSTAEEDFVQSALAAMGVS